MSFTRDWTVGDAPPEVVEAGGETNLIEVEFVTDVTAPGNWNFAINDFGEMDIEIPDAVNPDIGPDNELYTIVAR